MTFHKPIVLLIFALTIAFQTVYGQSSQTIKSKYIDELVEESMKRFNVAGAAVAIISNGQVIHKKGYGVRSIETGFPVDQFTNFQIASNSKAFTTTALAILVDDGLLSWKDRVRTIIPEFTMYDEYVADNFTIEDLLCHRSGMGLGIGDLMAFPDGADFTINDVLMSFQHFPPISDFRTEYAYDNMLYWVAGEVIARVTGLTWEKYIQDNIFNKLGLNSSYPSASVITGLEQILAESGASLNLAMPHSTEISEGEIKPISLYQAAISGSKGGILSNIHDLSIWVNMHLNAGRYLENGVDQQLFSPERQHEMWRIHTVTQTSVDPRYNQHFSGYGLGWNLSDIKGNMRVSHTGALPGMLSQITMIPDIGLGIIILTNTENGGSSLFNVVNNTILDISLELSDKDWMAYYQDLAIQQKSVGDSITNQVWQKVEKARDTPINPQDYIGVYEDLWFGEIEVLWAADKLWFRSYRSPKLNGPMSYYEPHTFAIKWDYQDMNADAFANFTLDSTGRANGIKMKGISPFIDFSFDFHDLNFRRVPEPRWTQLFNGIHLHDWIVKIAKHELGDNYGQTFRIEDGLLKIRYDEYEDFDQQFGHLHYNTPYSSYILRVEYRFVGEQAIGGDNWAWRNSGVMIHGQDPKTLHKNQNFPIALEVQFLGGDGIVPRPTANLCTPGSLVEMNEEILTAHCINSSSDTYHGDQWVKVDIIVLADSLIRHFVRGREVLSYSKPHIGGDNVNHYDPNIKVDGTRLRSGYISLQSESHPIDFRKVELLNLEPYMLSPRLLDKVIKKELSILSQSTNK